MKLPRGRISFALSVEVSELYPFSLDVTEQALFDNVDRLAVKGGFWLLSMSMRGSIDPDDEEVSGGGSRFRSSWYMSFQICLSSPPEESTDWLNMGGSLWFWVW